MKKLRTDTGGYALIYVLIVVLVLCAVAVIICTAALENYQAQEESVRQTQQLYQAEGEIEKFVALAEDVSSLTVSGTYVAEDADTEDAAKDKAKDAAKKAYEDYLTELVKPPDSGYTLTLDHDNSFKNPCKFTLAYQNDTVCIKTEISMALTYNVTPPDGTSETTYTAEVSTASHNYKTYTITHLTAEGGGGG